VNMVANSILWNPYGLFLSLP